MTEQETLYTIALTQVPSLSLANLHQLIDGLGSATAIYENRRSLGELLPAAQKKTLAALAAMDSHLSRAEEEMLFCQNGRIQCLGLTDDRYPQRLRDCPDAPVVLYYRGTADLNSRHIVSMVGTRQITPYGQDLCRTFIRDLRQLCPDALVVSGLAYGVDIHCHRAALSEGLDTVGVLAHGLEQIYPRLHRDTAKQMAGQGGLLTEYMSHAIIDKRNFVQRNRIVAGVADAVVVVESATRGRCGPSQVASSTTTRQDATVSSSRTKPLCSPVPKTSAKPWDGPTRRNTANNSPTAYSKSYSPTSPTPRGAFSKPSPAATASKSTSSPWRQTSPSANSPAISSRSK